MVPGVPSAASFGAWMDLRPGEGRQPDASYYAERLEEAELVEQLGLGAVWGSEHHADGDGHLSQQLPFLAAVAARTAGIRLGTGVLLLPLHRPRDVAEQAGVVDMVAGGRLLLGLGSGYAQHEFDAYGVERSARARRMEAGVAYMRRAFSDGLAGGYLPVVPRPAQQGGPPLLLGGMAPKALERVARIADGWFCLAHYRYQRAADAWPLLREALERAGRPVDGFPLVIGVHLWVSDDPERAWATQLAPALAFQLDRYTRWATDRGQPEPEPIDPQRLRRSAVLCDTPMGTLAALTELQERLPFTHVCLWSRPAGIGHEAACANLERVAAEVAPAFAGPEPAWRGGGAGA